MYLAEATIADMVPTQSAMPRRQRWYTGSAVDQLQHTEGIVFTRVRERGIRGEDRRLAFFEWSLDCDDPQLLTREQMRDEENIAAANPGYVVRLSREAVEDELNTLADRTAAVERFNVGDWPDLIGDGSVIRVSRWLELTDRDSRIDGAVWFAFDVSPVRDRGSIAVAGRRSDGNYHVEVLECRNGTGWMIDRLRELHRAHSPAAIVCDGASPAASLIPDLLTADVPAEAVNSGDHAKGCGVLFDAVDQGTLRHGGTGELVSALKGAKKAPRGDAWAWSRKNSTVDITPLVAVTLALWASVTSPPQEVWTSAW
jgi:hypothetical protein